jgi:hypothetical protein
MLNNKNFWEFYINKITQPVDDFNPDKFIVMISF